MGQNFPYATIEPEEARVIVPDARYDWLCEQYQPKSKVPANLTVRLVKAPITSSILLVADRDILRGPAHFQDRLLTGK